MQVADMRFSFKATLLILVLGLSGLSVFAQTITGRISGTIVDPSGAVVPGVRVTTVNTETKLARTATTDLRCRNWREFGDCLPCDELRVPLRSECALGSSRA